MIGISHIPHCYSNLVVTVTKDFSITFVLSPYSPNLPTSVSIS